MTSLVLALLTAAPCVVEGTDFTTRGLVQLTVDGGAPLPASLRNVRARAVLDGKRATLQLDEPIALTATTKRLRLEVASEVSLFDGGVVLRPGASVQWRESNGGTLAGDVIVEPDGDELETEDKRPALTFAVRGVPCSALTLDHVSNTPVAEHPGPFVEARPPLALWPTPRAQAPMMTLTSPVDRFSLFFRLVARQGSFALVEYLDDSGRVTVRGWVAAKAITPLPEGAGIGRSSMCTGDHEGAMGFGNARAGGKLVHLGPLELAPSTVLTFDCPTKTLPERRCPVGVVTKPVEGQTRWYGGATAEVSFGFIHLQGEVFTIDAATVKWPDAGTR